MLMSAAVGSGMLLPDSSVESHAVPVRVSPAATAFSFFCVFVLIFLLYLPFSLPCTLSQVFPATSHPLSSNRSLLILFTAFLIFLLYSNFLRQYNYLPRINNFLLCQTICPTDISHFFHCTISGYTDLI